jgi:Rrf2 family protein
MFSKACEYAIRSCIYIASVSIQGKRVGLIDVAEKIQSPEAFTSKILQKLVKQGIVKSIKGPGGGFEIPAKELATISLLQVIESIDGTILNRCSLGLSECSEKNPCPFHNRYKPIKDKLLHTFSHTTMKDLTQNYINSGYFLKL